MVHSPKLKKKTILVTGSTSRFCKFLKNGLKNYSVIFTKKKDFNILNYKKMYNFIKNKKVDYLINIAGLSRPMSIHDKNIILSIDLNIVGTANIVKLCKMKNIKLIYFSTSYVYPGTKGNYNERDPIKPINNYAWSKLGGEASVKLYKNSLILRICMTDFPFVHKKAIKGAKSSFIYNKYVAEIIPYILNESGILNIGGKKRDIFHFAKKFAKKNIEPISLKKIKNFPKDSSICIKNFKKIIKKNKIKLIL